jgi:hypothetical protein
MIRRRVRQLLFFSLVFLLFYLAVQLGHNWAKSGVLSPLSQEVLMGMLYTGVIVGVYYLARLDRCSSAENFWDVNPASRCRGGEYMWQGDSEIAKYCKALAKTPEGRVAISSYNCPTGFVGIPMVPYEYTPLSDDNWEDARIQPQPQIPLVDPGPKVQANNAQIQN